MSEVFILSEKCFVIILYMLKPYYSNVLGFFSFKPSAVHFKIHIFDFLEASKSTLFQKARCWWQKKTKSSQSHLGSSFDALL